MRTPLSAKCGKTCWISVKTIRKRLIGSIDLGNGGPIGLRGLVDTTGQEFQIEMVIILVTACL